MWIVTEDDMFDLIRQREAGMGLYKYLQSKNIPGFNEHVKSVDIAKGKLVYDVGVQQTGIYEIVSGVIKLGGKNQHDEGYVYDLVMPGDIFGNVSFLNKPFREYGKVVLPAKLYVFNRDFFIKEVLQDAVAAELFVKKIVHRWHKTETVLSAIRHFEPRERISRMLDSLDVSLPVNNRSVKLNKNLTHKDIADLTGTTRQLVAEVLR